MGEKTYLLDTNVFNHLVEGKVDEQYIRGKRLAATSIQLEEIKKTPNQKHREELLCKFQEIVRIKVMPPFAWDVPGAGWDEGQWTDGPEFEIIREKVRKYDKRKSKAKDANEDALIAVAALTHGFVLVTHDGALKSAVQGLVEYEDWVAD